MILFGSRAKGNFRKGSDIDLAIVSEKNTPKIAERLHFDLEETHLPYFVDVVDVNKITSLKLKEHIQQCGKKVF